MAEAQMTGTEQAKRTARSLATARRDTVPQEVREQKSAWICERLSAVLDQLLGKNLGSSHPSAGNSLQPSATVAVYAAMRSEADPSAFARYAEKNGCVVAYPCMLDPQESTASSQRMCMRAVRYQDLGDASFIAHPARPFAVEMLDSARFPIVHASDIDLIVVPVVAFDGRNMRLGYGGGCYDRYLPTLRADCQIIGIAFNEQRLPAVPTGPHDLTLPRIISA